MSDVIRKNIAVIVNLIVLLFVLAFGYGLLNKDIETTKIQSNKNEASIVKMREEWHRDVKIILEKVSTLEGYVKAKERNENK